MQWAKPESGKTTAEGSIPSYKRAKSEYGKPLATTAIVLMASPYLVTVLLPVSQPMQQNSAKNSENAKLERHALMNGVVSESQ